MIIPIIYKQTCPRGQQSIHDKKRKMNDNNHNKHRGGKKRSEMHSAKLVYQEEIEIASESQLLERGSHGRASSDLSRHGEREGSREGGGGGGGVEQANGLGNDREKGVRVDVSGGGEAGGE